MSREEKCKRWLDEALETYEERDVFAPEAPVSRVNFNIAVLDDGNVEILVTRKEGPGYDRYLLSASEEGSSYALLLQREVLTARGDLKLLGLTSTRDMIDGIGVDNGTKP